MPTFEVEYEYIIPEYGVTTVMADSVDQAEEAALEQLSESLDPEIKGVSIESIRELKN
jgi:hypothetical protein